MREGWIDCGLHLTDSFAGLGINLACPSNAYSEDKNDDLRLIDTIDDPVVVEDLELSVCFQFEAEGLANLVRMVRKQFNAFGFDPLTDLGIELPAVLGENLFVEYDPISSECGVPRHTAKGELPLFDVDEIRLLGLLVSFVGEGAQDIVFGQFDHFLEGLVVLVVEHDGDRFVMAGKNDPVILEFFQNAFGLCPELADGSDGGFIFDGDHGM